MTKIATNTTAAAPTAEKTGPGLNWKKFLKLLVIRDRSGGASGSSILLLSQSQGSLDMRRSELSVSKWSLRTRSISRSDAPLLLFLGELPLPIGLTSLSR